MTYRRLFDDQAINKVLMDCNMPAMNGYDASIAIRRGQAGAKHAATPIIAKTANVLKGESEKCYDATEFTQKVKVA